MSKKTWTGGAIILGIIFIIIAMYYWLTPAQSLPHFVPGYEAGVTTVHLKHGLAALILGIALFIFAWFKSGPSTKQENQ